MSTHTEVAETLAALADMAHKRRPDDQVLSDFLVRYYRELPDEDADDRRLDEAYAAAVTHLMLGRVRAPGEVLVRVLSPKADRDGWRTERSILMFVTDDIPFLVDTVRMVLDRYDLGIHLMVHPMLPIARNEANEVIGFFDEADTDQAAEGDATPMVEAWTLIELDRCAPDVEQQLEADVATAIGEVRPSRRATSTRCANGWPRSPTVTRCSHGSETNTSSCSALRRTTAPSAPTATHSSNSSPVPNSASTDRMPVSTRRGRTHRRRPATRRS